MSEVNWTEVLIAFITVGGSTVSAVFAARSGRASAAAAGHAATARQSADIAVEASLRPLGRAPGGELESMHRVAIHERTPTIPDAHEVMLPPDGDEDDPQG